MTWRRRGGIKRGESSLASNQSLCALHLLDLSESYIEKRRGRKETEVTRSRKGGIKRRETDLASN